MLKRLSISMVFVLGLVVLFAAAPAEAQLGNAGAIEGVVKRFLWRSGSRSQGRRFPMP